MAEIIEKVRCLKHEPVHQEFQSDQKALNAGARHATEAEHSLTIWRALKIYKKAALWSILISTAVIMEGYDNHLLGNFIGYPAFRKRYGTWLNAKSGYQISSKWQAGLTDIGSVGNIIGALLNGYFTPKFGPRKVLMAALVWLTGTVFITFFAPNIETILVGQLLCSIPWGICATTAPAYAAEVGPLALRGYLTAYVNVCFCAGQLISAGVLKALVNNATQWSYRIPFATQWIWPLPLFIGVLFAPESPWYLVRAGKLDEAKRACQKLSSDNESDDDSHIALMMQTNNLEKAEREGVTYWDAIRGTNLRRTEIACVVYLSQITSGSVLCYSGTFFYEQTGMSASTSYALGLAGTGISVICSALSWFYISRWGRRDIWLGGFCLSVVILFLIGILACVPKSFAISWAQGLLCLAWLAVYSMSIGPIVFTIVAEIGSTRLRTQTIVLGRSVYYIGNIVGGVLEPYFMSPTSWNAAGKTAFFWGGLALLTATWGFFRLPETAGRTFAELDIMFHRRIPARKSATYQIDLDEEFVG
ncbi:general substrate transporter [Talaromyces proteolyticus]|uniref:General substrate transporter n=1 Tax=Talaromyces proteolyticus TaxID=1131652 RepID=A0AAD4KLK8_9EURO|nr:general substrate transporter [Talaromyces proteolyticus]KAH8694153.1 general substrate transporter [Talaromyces proteolyticus]